MKCPYCKVSDKDRVVDSRSSSDDSIIRRRRHCDACGRRYTTYERVEVSPTFVVKKDQRREPFERQKVLSGIMKACEKRPVSVEVQEGIVEELEKMVDGQGYNEITTTQIGEFVMERLAEIDEVAYVRFASVYRQFKDVTQFMKEVNSLLKK
ncbi:MAG: transcriptional repressor NrdR [Candidatus Omnitrophica bacterium]|nr:transcriptional repressor NrdR [Candidatus Omnitrophota bacterium]